jgi:hypothetical protein
MMQAPFQPARYFIIHAIPSVQTLGLYVPPIVRAAEFDRSPDSSLLAFAAHGYDPVDYIRNYAEFCQASNAPSS